MSMRISSNAHGRHRRAGRFGLVLLFLLATCDTAEPDSPCPAEPRTGEVEYFPVGIGSEWKYAIESYDSFFGSTSSFQGELTRTVRAAEDCADGRRTFLVDEKLERLVGDERSVVRDTTIRFIVTDDGVWPGNYFHSALPRNLPDSSGPELTLYMAGGEL